MLCDDQNKEVKIQYVNYFLPAFGEIVLSLFDEADPERDLTGDPAAFTLDLAFADLSFLSSVSYF